MSHAAILSIGTELTRGELVNGNACWLGERLVQEGFTVVEHVSVADDAERIRQTLLRLAREVKVIVCTGGLGPTSDDLTTAAVADALGVRLVRDEATVAAIEARYQSLQRTMPAMNAKQGDFPQGARILANSVGTAPGFAVQVGQARAFFMPGVPREMGPMFDTQVVPEIALLVTRRSHQVHIRCFGLFESAVAERLRDLDVGGARQHPGITIGYRVTFPEVEVKVLAEAENVDAARELAERTAVEVRELLGDAAYGGKSDTYPRYVAELLRTAKVKIAIAESCTGGLIGKLLTDPPGSSAYMLGGAIAYANTAKQRLLGIEEAALRTHGAISEETARAMAENALRITEADLAVGVTGVAGPTGGTDQRPVGTVCFALARRDGATLTFTERFPGAREFVRTVTAYHALRLLGGAAKEKLDAAQVTRAQST